MEVRTVFFIGLCFYVSGFSAAQTASVPTVILDSLIYETKLGRQCNQVMQAQQEEIQALGKENVHLGTALKLSQSESSTLSNLLTNAKKGNEILASQFALDISKEKRKTKRWRRIGFIEAVVILGIILTTRI